MNFTSRYLIGIDLGTTNSAVAYVDTNDSIAESTSSIQLFKIPQLVADAEIEPIQTLPSFLYFADNNETESGRLKLPWNDKTDAVVGLWAREQGALTPNRQVSSAKSWLSHAAVDRMAKILPWGADHTEQACSPVEASSKYLTHIRDAWNHTIASINEEYRFEKQEIVLTVPASFDEEARELTVKAANDAGLSKLTLLEEPLAAFYAWIIGHRRSLKRYVKDNNLILVCDVGGGTTDFSLIRVRIVDGKIQFERTAIGEHLLLGGDNLDLALAKQVEAKLSNPKLTLRQQNALRRQCCAAKEKLLSKKSVSSVPINILGSGRSLIGGALSTELTREEVLDALLNGFLPAVSSEDLPAREKRTALRELGLPYATEAAITKHLAAFLKQAVDSSDEQTLNKMVRPDAILFNGGFFATPVAQERIVNTISQWFHEEGSDWKPKVLVNENLESAVAVGAAYYGLVKHGSGLRISGGSARAYYIGIQSANKQTGQVQVVCVLPRGVDEGTKLQLSSREFTVLTNRPVSFTLYSSISRNDLHGEVITIDPSDLYRHAPLVTVLGYGKRSRQIELDVQLAVSFTEVGTLELWFESINTEHRWRLQFQLRGIESEVEVESSEHQESQTLIDDASTASAIELIHAVFNKRPSVADEPVKPESLVGKLEAVLGYRKDAWPITTIRKLCDVLIEVSDGRKKGSSFEARWLNLFGFCLRPGFGSTLDDWRINHARKIYLAGLLFPKDMQCQVEWLILWRRIAGGLNSGQQRELYERHSPMVGVGGKKGIGRFNRQIDQEAWLLLASLEHLPVRLRVSLGKELLSKIKEDPTHKGYIWSLGRLGARIPFYGPLNCLVPVEEAVLWLKFLLNLPTITSEIASAIVQLGARTNDPLRDIPEDLRLSVAEKLKNAGISSELIENLRSFVPPKRKDAARIFGESLPEGLRLKE
jgi:molecular chaperone DnaK (HSP70)